MDELPPFRFWLYRFAYLGLGLLLVVQAILPLDLRAHHIPGPDILYCITMAYIIRRPEYVPLWSIVLVFFLRDVLTLSPLGLGTFVMVISSQAVRANLQAFREYFFGIEWLWISGIFVAVVVLRNLILGLTLSGGPKLSENLYELLFTILTYPFIVLILRYVFSMERPVAGKTDARGHQI